jgi:glyoxylase-like metal-dependent hydrolase (beta-lactamase superfamily II)
MSEPKTVAKATEEIAHGIHHYRIHDDRINHGSDALAIVEKGKVVLVDPLPLDPAALARLGPIGAIVVTAASHQRSAWHLRRESKAKVYAPAGMGGTDEQGDVAYADGDLLPGGLRAIAVAGPKAPHFALYREAKPAMLYTADLVMHEPDGIVFLPDKYLADPPAARESIRRLTDRQFEVIAFGHGAPIRSGGPAALAAALKKDEAARKKT